MDSIEKRLNQTVDLQHGLCDNDLTEANNKQEK